MEMEIGDCVFTDIGLSTCEFELAHPGLHHDYFILLLVHDLRLDSIQDVNRASDTSPELVRSSLVVFQVDVFNSTNSDCKKFRSIGARLDLVIKAEPAQLE